MKDFNFMSPVSTLCTVTPSEGKTWPCLTVPWQSKSGMTVEGLQEWYDEACLVVYNNKYNDGVQWHDVPCFTRGRIICEDSDLQMERVKLETGLDVTVPESEKAGK